MTEEIRYEVHVWEAEDEPVEPHTWAGHLQIIGLEEWDKRRPRFGGSALQATMLTWFALHFNTQELGGFVTGTPGSMEDLSMIPIAPPLGG